MKTVLIKTERVEFSWYWVGKFSEVDTYVLEQIKLSYR